jgi:hypothetical protein
VTHPHTRGAWIGLVAVASLAAGLAVAGQAGGGLSATSTAPAAASPAPSAAAPEPRRTFTAKELPGPPVAPEVVIPTGTKADLLLWKEAYDSQNDLVIQRVQAKALLRKFFREKHDGRLQRLAADSQAPDLRKLHAVRQDLGSAWREVQTVMTAKWPVDPRLSCRQQFHELEGALQALQGSSGAEGLPQARLELRGCLGKLSSVLVPLRAANGKLVAAFAEAERALTSTTGTAGGG